MGGKKSRRYANRRTVLRRFTVLCVAGLQVGSCSAFSSPLNKAAAAIQDVTGVSGIGSMAMAEPSVAYKSMAVSMDEFGVSVPVAVWFPLDKGLSSSSSMSKPMPPVQYEHSISIKRIGELLAGWKFIPGFAKKDFRLQPTLPAGSVVSSIDGAFPSSGPVVFLAHGYLGSRFDLSHLAEELAKQGASKCMYIYPCVCVCVCVSIQAVIDKRGFPSCRLLISVLVPCCGLSIQSTHCSTKPVASTSPNPFPLVS